jgi:hypothetical protein
VPAQKQYPPPPLIDRSSRADSFRAFPPFIFLRVLKLNYSAANREQVPPSCGCRRTTYGACAAASSIDTSRIARTEKPNSTSHFLRLCKNYKRQQRPTRTSRSVPCSLKHTPFFCECGCRRSRLLQRTQIHRFRSHFLPIRQQLRPPGPAQSPLSHQCTRLRRP